MKIFIQAKKGFILFITLMMLIIFAILGISLYQQTTQATTNIQYVTFKQEAEDLAMLALNEIENNIKERSKTHAWAVCVKKDSMTEKEQMLCDPLPEILINQALTDLSEGKKPTDFLVSNNKFKWQELAKTGTFSKDGSTYYIIQQLGKDSKDIGYLLFRVTIIAGVLDTYSVISAVTAVPEKDEAATNP